MAWFKRSKDNIDTSTQKKDVKDGTWIKCPECSEMMHKKQWEANLYLCTKCSHHFRIGSEEYFNILLDEKSFREMDRKIRSTDPLEFSDTKPYKKRLEETIKGTDLFDAVRTGTGKINNINVVIACMDFGFIGGSMGSVVGEKISRAIDKALKTKNPLIIISSSGGARMMEGAISLMQLAKTSSRLAKLDMEKIPYISILTNPTTGGTTASFSMLGDINIAEPKALIAFAGPRVVKQATGKDLPAGFQRSEFLLKHGFIDLIVSRKDLKDKLTTILNHIQN
ncbi:MAG TPA: acetyl-CoA carboxylase, carboxyltransferase subunit beta [Ignavibacteria bacterium]|nr:acetyl-CoA carboxylase, carboxyltransferase subunit beta [Ignavibacteria bacterium]HMR40569.1 acetyl-CoA carboxylase, carboxyltransferase subunit beta [Ignavibacteria bacterium]